MIAKLANIMPWKNGEWIASFTTSTNIAELYDELAGKEVNIEIKKHNRHRSLDANAYCWVLIDKIAEKTGERKLDVYRQAIREIGGVSDTVCVQDKAVERLCDGWKKNGIGWQTDTMPSKVNGCTNVILYYGSSVYDSKQMSQLIDSLIQDAEALGIPTLTDEQAAKLIGNWNKKQTQAGKPVEK